MTIGKKSTPQTGFVQPYAAVTVCDTDGGVLVQICTTVNYLYYTGGTCPSGHRCATLTSANNQYNRKDPGAGSFQAKWKEGASGRCTQGCSGILSGTHDFGWRTVTPGSVYTDTGWWNGQYTMLDNALQEQRGGTATLDFYFRTKAYSFSMTTLVPAS